MNWIFRLACNRPKSVMAFFAMTTILLAIPALKIRLDVSPDGLMPRQSPRLDEYNLVKQAFGSDIVASIYIRDPQLFTSEKLSRLRLLNNQLANLEGVEKAESLFTALNIQNVEGSLDTNALLDYIPDQPGDIKKRQAAGLKNPLLKRAFISEDGNATVIALYLVKKEGDLKFDDRMAGGIETILSDYRKDFKELFQTGDPYINSSMASYILSDQVIIVPLSLIILLGSIWLSMRNIHCAIIPLLNAIISIVWTLGIMSLLGIPVNILSYVVPALSLIIGATEDIHMCAEYLDGRREGHEPRDIVRSFGKKLGIILLFTGGTTIFGFASIGFTDLVIMQDFGKAAGLAMAANFVITLFFVPAYLILFGRKMNPGKGHEDSHHPRWVEKTASIISLIIDRHSKPVIVIFIVTFLGSAFLASRLVLNNDLISFFKPGSPIVASLDTLHENLVGSRVVYVTLSGSEGDFKRSTKLKDIEELERYLRGHKQFDSVTSLPDFVSLIHREMNEGNQELHQIPGEDNLIAQYLLLLNRSDIERYVTSDYSQANIVIRHNINSTSDFNKIIGQIRKELATPRYSNYKSVITGQGVLIAESADNIAWGQVISLSSNIVLIFLLMALMFLSFKAGILAVVPNVWPIFIIFGTMAILGIPLSVGTSMVAAITLGIAVDDTIHLLGIYNHNIKNLGDERRALDLTIRQELVPILASSTSLACGFLVLSFSSFVPVAQFGKLSAFVMIMAVIGELLLTPILLSSVRLITLWDSVGLDLRERVIKRCPLFHGMRRWEIRRLILMSRLVEHPAGEMIIKSGEIGDTMYIVLEGQLTAHQTPRKTKSSFGGIQAGDVFGEMALVLSSKRKADVVTETPVKLLEINWKTLEILQRYLPHTSSRFFLNLSKILGTRWIDATRQLEPEQ